jgi:hypothetical protein
MGASQGKKVESKDMKKAHREGWAGKLAGWEPS